MHDCNIWSNVFPISSKNEFNGLRFTLPAGIHRFVRGQAMS